MSLEDQVNAVHTAIFGWPLDHLSHSDQLLQSASLQDATKKLINSPRVRQYVGAAIIDFLDLDLKSQLDVIHTVLFGWPLDALSPLDELVDSSSIQEATYKLLASSRFRFFTREIIPVWPVDKWVCTDYFGLRLWVNLHDSYVAHGVLQGNWENDEVAFVLDNLSPGDSMIDVGANVGVYTMQAARKVGPEGRIYAFEPQTDTFGMLRRSVSENHFGDRCRLYNFALGDRDGPAAVWRHHDTNPGASIITSQEMVGPGNATSLKRLDSMEFDRPIKLLKMDIEGYEPLLVAGGQAFFRTHRPIIITEWFPRSIVQVAGSTAEYYFQQILDLGYTVHLLDGRNIGAVLTKDAVSSYSDIQEPFNIICLPSH